MKNAPFVRPAAGRPALLVFAVCLLAAIGPGRAVAADTSEADPHAHHHHMMSEMKHATRSTAQYSVPAVTVVRDDGARVSLVDELDDCRPVLLNFIFTTCTTICPVMTQTFAQVQAKLGGERVHLVSISIDPEEDTPARLAEYARKFHAGPSWRFYTGSVEASTSVQRAFGAYRGDKMNHTPLTLLRAGPGRPWVRLDGFASADEIVSEFHQQLAAR